MAYFIDLPCDLLIKIFQLVDRRTKISLLLINRTTCSTIQGYLHESIYFHVRLSAIINSSPRKNAFEYAKILADSQAAIISYLANDNKPSTCENLINRDLINCIKPKHYYSLFSFFSEKRQIYLCAEKRHRLQSYYLLRWIPHTDNIYDLIVLLYNVSKESIKLRLRLFPVISEALHINSVVLSSMEKAIEEFLRNFLQKGDSVGVVDAPTHDQVKINAMDMLIRRSLFKRPLIKNDTENNNIVTFNI